MALFVGRVMFLESMLTLMALGKVLFTDVGCNLVVLFFEYTLTLITDASPVPKFNLKF